MEKKYVFHLYEYDFLRLNPLAQTNKCNYYKINSSSITVNPEHNTGCEAGIRTSLMVLQSTVGHHVHMFTPQGNLSKPIHLHSCFWEVGGK